MVVTKDARVAWDMLTGIMCVYKPAELTVGHVRNAVLGNLTRELNEMKCQAPVQHVFIEGNTNKQLSVEVRPSFADHPLIMGPRYNIKDFKCRAVTVLGRYTSGVLVMGLNEGNKLANLLCQMRPTKVYRVHGKLGRATDNYYKDGKVVEKTTFRHVKKHHMERLIAYMQTAHQKKMFELSGLDIQSQAAYEAAAQGLIRPANANMPLLYGIKCINFNSPDFTLEIQCTNEYENYFMALVHDIGMQLKSSANCTGIQCIRHSLFTLEHALLRKHWTMQEILDNLRTCTKILQKNQSIVRPSQPTLKLITNK